jgi:hypothetical protein
MKRLIFQLSALVVAASAVACSPSGHRPDDGLDPSHAMMRPGGNLYSDATFRATHNSYAMPVSLPAQLDHGVRCVELDIHDANFKAEGDYQVGHFFPAQGVSFGKGNPDTAHLRAWLGCIEQWSREHAGHAPITLIIDIKDDLMDNRGVAGGNPEFLNEELASVFGTRLFRARDFRGTWPALDAMRNRIIVVLSGNRRTRREYRVARNRHEQICFVEFERDDDPRMLDEATAFFGAENGAAEWARTWRSKGKLVRLWKFNGRPAAGGDPLAQFPATDRLLEGWYESYCRSRGAVD